ncbi:MAG: chitobiase/beta-hexosaminidase C-terminal domain-containing protein [Firmicutes bacterium]|nr:chitobiase/beta-hexosaminidase C-terminal domain-containing protein [Bacillota bacterium]
MIRVSKRHYRVFAVLMVLSLLFSTVASAAVPPAPVISPTPGTYSESVTVSVYSSVGAKVYYTTNEGDPKTSGLLYTAPFTLNDDATVKAVAYNDDGYSDVATAGYVVKTVLERLNALSSVLDRVYRLTPDQMSSVVDIVYEEIGVLWNGVVLSDSEKASLAGNGITEDALKGVVNAFKGYVAGLHYGYTGYEGFQNAIGPDSTHRDYVYLGAGGSGLYQSIRDSFPQSFKDSLAAKGTSVDDLIDAIISLADLNLVMGLTLTPELKAQAKSIFEEKIVKTSNITLQMLVNNGLTFDNAQEVIDGLTDKDKSTLRAAIWTMGYLGAPKASPGPGTYNGPVTVSFSSDTPGATIYYTLNENPWSVAAATYLNEGSLTITSTTTVHAAAYADGVYTEPVDFTYNISAPVTLSSISLSLGSSSLTVGGTTNSVVTATYSDNSSADVTGSASYTSSAPAVATVNAGGVVTAVGVGQTVITATYGGKTATATVTVSAAGGTVKGSVVPQGLSAGYAGITVILRSGAQEVKSVTTSADGSYQMDNVPAGNYTVLIKCAKYLSYEVTGVAVATGSTVNLNRVDLLVGDANGDDMIGGLDFSELLSAWNKNEGDSGYKQLCDFNGDKSIGGLDFSLLLQNWNKKGATAP